MHAAHLLHASCVYVAKHAAHVLHACCMCLGCIMQTKKCGGAVAYGLWPVACGRVTEWHVACGMWPTVDGRWPQTKKCGGAVVDCKYEWSNWKFVGDKDCPTQKTRNLKITKEANACGKQCPKIRDETVDVKPSKTDCEGRLWMCDNKYYVGMVNVSHHSRSRNNRLGLQ